MELAKKMPDCFEKCLIRICYYLSLLRMPDFKDENEDKILNKCKTKDECLEQLKKDISNLEHLMTVEK